MKETKLLGILFLFILQGISQDALNNRDYFKLHLSETEEQIEIDGILDEDIWSSLEIAKPFYRILPIDTGYASAQTEVMVTYNRQYLYMAIICHDTLEGKRPVESLRRDFSFGKNDNFLVFIDTYNDQTNGFSFGVSAAGAQWDGLQANGGFVSLDWDCKWRSAVKNEKDRWVAEFEIPFRSIRYAEGVKRWGINFSRLDLKQNEKSSWAPVPRQFQSANLAYTGSLIWDKAPPKLGTRFSIIPYIAGRSSKNVEQNEASQFSSDIGADAKITLSTSLNLDLTINPDFSQVDVDRQVTNLDRFELFFPERRQFFLENSDLFASLGSENNRPFFSRRIGLDSDVIAGARLSGKIGSDWRVGLMNMQTNSKGSTPSSNFLVAAVQKKIFSRSNIGFFVVNKQFTAEESAFPLVQNKFNRVAGVDFNLASEDNKWTGKAFFHQSLYEGNPKDAFTASAALAYASQSFAASFTQSYIGSNYSAETGFIRRKGIHQLSPVISYKFFPGNSTIANHGPQLTFDNFLDTDFQLTDREIELSYGIQWLNRSSLSVDLEDGYVRLLAPFDPTNSGKDTLATGSEFNWKEISINYQSDARKLFNYMAEIRYGGFFNGDRLSLNGEINYRFQPYGSLAITASYNNIILPAPFEDTDFLLLGPRLDLTFTDKLFLTTFLQSNEQLDNMNVNIRLQWRFAPVSDFFLVYTDNSYPGDLRTKNRALVAKLSYWLN